MSDMPPDPNADDSATDITTMSAAMADVLSGIREVCTGQANALLREGWPKDIVWPHAAGLLRDLTALQVQSWANDMGVVLLATMQAPMMYVPEAEGPPE